MKKSLTPLVAAITLIAITATNSVSAQDTKIKIADSFPVGHYIPEYIVKEMMDRFKAKSLGVEFEYYPAQQMGKSKDMLALAQNGVVDIAYVAPAFVSDKMPHSVVAELPLDFTGSCKGTLAYWNLAKPGGLISKKDFEPNGVRLLFTLVLPPYQLQTRKSFTSIKELEGQKIRTSGSAKELVVRQIKAIPVQIPTPDVYETLSRGTIDGMLFPFNSLPPYDLHKITKFSTVSENFGSFVANYVISDKKWAALSLPVKRELTVLGEELAFSACSKVEKDEAKAIEISQNSGLKLVTLSAADKQSLKQAMKSVAKDWADNLDKRGGAGTEVLNAFEAGLK
jgi:TRAP-type C4-dicarboxylate transport system substrate-binding protein